MGQIFTRYACKGVLRLGSRFQCSYGRIAAAAKRPGIAADGLALQFSFVRCKPGGDILSGKLLRCVDQHILIDQSAAAHFNGFEIRKILYSVLRVIIEEGAGADGQTLEILFTHAAVVAAPPPYHFAVTLALPLLSAW